MAPGEPIGRGRTAEVFAWDKESVLKLYYDWRPAGWVDHEVQLAQHVEELGLPVARLYDGIAVERDSLLADLRTALAGSQ